MVVFNGVVDVVVVNAVVVKPVVKLGGLYEYDLARRVQPFGGAVAFGTGEPCRGTGPA